MQDIIQSAKEMIANMTPVLRPGTFVFASVLDPVEAERLEPAAISVFREDEGVSLVLPLETARRAGLDVSHRMRCITLNVYSSLEGVGLTAAVANVLAEHDIPCNMVAGFNHDHVFLPHDLADGAMKALAALQNRVSGGESI